MKNNKKEILDAVINTCGKTSKVAAGITVVFYFIGLICSVIFDKKYNNN